MLDFHSYRYPATDEANNLSNVVACFSSSLTQSPRFGGPGEPRRAGGASRSEPPKEGLASIKVLEHLHRGVEIAGVNPISTPRGKTYAPPGGVNPELDLSQSISNGRGVDRPGFGGLQADVPKCHRCVTLVQFMDCRLMAGVDLWRAKLPKVAAEGGIGPPPPSLAASVAAPLEDNYTLRAAKVHSRSRDGSSVGDALMFGLEGF
ncbi:hypothetical protein PCANC_09285 [Puccinia coronata f. sp. avenae]|uniref:Uncharacterized protein n=1 Tax=Puccinia coronata f. sp. avenae TaxID=200324 RepID=A0A2N5T5I8_9BASI|nr:hypothetical protein PCANC_09285 [Puccinia coronata f. sp. avenae]